MQNSLDRTKTLSTPWLTHVITTLETISKLDPAALTSTLNTLRKYAKNKNKSALVASMGMVLDPHLTQQITTEVLLIDPDDLSYLTEIIDHTISLPEDELPLDTRRLKESYAAKIQQQLQG